MKQQRNSRQRQLVLDVVKARRDHPTADQIYLDARVQNSTISRGTVYRNLNLLAENGEILQIKNPTADRFDCRMDPHYHLLCTVCKAISDAPLPYQGELDRALSHRTGYALRRHQAIFEGVCPECRKKTATKTAAPIA